MPEDQGWNGDRWTEEASALLKRLGWEKIADSNIDIEGTDGLWHGIDALFRYEDGFSSYKQGVFLEAKRYQNYPVYSEFCHPHRQPGLNQ